MAHANVVIVDRRVGNFHQGFTNVFEIGFYRATDRRRLYGVMAKDFHN